MQKMSQNDTNIKEKRLWAIPKWGAIEKSHKLLRNC